MMQVNYCRLVGRMKQCNASKIFESQLSPFALRKKKRILNSPKTGKKLKKTEKN
jgi:hypothetical protein